MAGVRILAVVVLVGWIQLTWGSCQSGLFGDSCSYSCHCETSCDVTTGACSGECDKGWTKGGGLCQKQNIALKKTTSTASGVYGNWYPSNAVDGDSDIAGSPRTCFHAGKSPSDWTVDLGRDYQLYDIRIYSRDTFYWRNANSDIYLNNDTSNICSTLPNSTSTPNPTDVTCNGTGRQVTIMKQGPGGTDGYASALNICEVEIYACSPGIYGVNCDTFCHCLNSSCDRLTGFCPGDCRPGWQGQRCDTACNNTNYGTSCNKTCAWRKCLATNSSCDRRTGACDTGCLPGWIDEDCTQKCAIGKYGANCSGLCSDRHCSGKSSCDHVIGTCDFGCEAGWMGADCKYDCDSKHYGPNCLGACSSRHCLRSSSCNSAGACDSGCETGWRLADCTVPVKCSDGRYGPGCSQVCSSRNCITQSFVCDVTGTCPNGCRDGWQNVDCRTPCPSGKYGSNCSKSCDSRQCETAQTTCDHVTGTCTAGCREGWIGADCTEKCKLGTFGPDCSRCGHCDVTCNVGDGRCPGECLDGFSGDRCDVDIRVSPVTSGVIGGAVVMVVMLLLIGGLMICLLRAGRLKWIPPNGTESRKTDTGYTGEISAHAHISGVNDPDYSELNDVTREREEKSQYDVIQNKVHENNQI
ncbi:multiple epidermal growth factor-like domains protein 10 isoform X1 [Haliotis rufescens]|uniref:multiple epidermal growth factor-like domains protein 10 isoform X1 n=1 Tax=Haliotis rufescens TaxID=6454 RepID=UPI00201EEF87|nr:multiple epidermal growth factor-like domains protein 10 isoform X1 [Haliotis rufescens]